MQKVVGSSPISRLEKTCKSRGLPVEWRVCSDFSARRRSQVRVERGKAQVSSGFFAERSCSRRARRPIFGAALPIHYLNEHGRELASAVIVLRVRWLWRRSAASRRIPERASIPSERDRRLPLFVSMNKAGCQGPVWTRHSQGPRLVVGLRAALISLSPLVNGGRTIATSVRPSEGPQSTIGLHPGLQRAGRRQRRRCGSRLTSRPSAAADASLGAGRRRSDRIPRQLHQPRPITSAATPALLGLRPDESGMSVITRNGVEQTLYFLAWNPCQPASACKSRSSGQPGWSLVFRPPLLSEALLGVCSTTRARVRRSPSSAARCRSSSTAGSRSVGRQRSHFR
jgi:hypothetical protein